MAAGKGGTQEIVITCHAAADLETPAFDAFLAQAVAVVSAAGQGRRRWSPPSELP